MATALRLTILPVLVLGPTILAVAGPRGMAERDPAGLWENDARSPETRDAAVALHVEVNRET